MPHAVYGRKSGVKRTFDPRRAILQLGLTALLGACSDDIGDCDEVAAAELVYSQDGLVATKGQAIAHDSCGNGAFCHSAAAEGAARYGAPVSLNFDLLPRPTGWPSLIDHRAEAWEQVESGHMPPGAAGLEVLGDNGWSFAVDGDERAGKLAPLSQRAGKAVFRNWLACGAPLVNDTQLPSWVRAGSAEPLPPNSDFESIYQTILRGRCASAGCHNTAAAGKLAMVDACGAYEALLESGSCGQPRVKAGDTSSLLLDKLETREPSCGGPMPPTAALPAELVDVLRNWIGEGAKAPSCASD
jgi:hypothetical protein